jgi:rod shape-determining protein MreC
VTIVAHWIVNAPADGISSFIAGSGDFFNGVFHSGQLSAENRRLRSIANAEALYNTRLTELQEQIDSLEKLEKIPPVAGKKKIAARVIGIFPDEYRVSLSVGADEGVMAGVPVIAPDGLLGVISTVEKHSSQATLIWAPLPFKIGAIVADKPQSAGLIHGDSWEHLTLDLSINAPIKAGDLVTTSGFSEKIPRGIPIGIVSAVVQDQDFGTERAQILPKVDLGNVQEVFVLR